MEAAFWHERWESGQIGFHLERVNPRLQKYWPRLSLAEDAAVFVPLCGKSVDLAWLADRGHRVLGIEFSPIAIAEFFAEFGHSPGVRDTPPFKSHEAAGVRLLEGDFFALTPEDLPDMAAVYDRASLIALPPDMRPRYARHLGALSASGTRVLLITLEYDQQEMDGPPFSVGEEEVRRLFEPDFEVEEFELTGELELPPRFRERGLTRMRERIYGLRRR